MKKWCKKIVIPLSMLYILMIMGYIPLPKLFTINVSASMPLGIYLLEAPEDINRGDIIVFEADDDVMSIAYERGWMKPGMHFLKYVYAVGGDVYSIKNGRYIVNGVDKGAVQKYDSESRTLPSFLHEGDYVVPDGYILTGTPAMNSFDSRYYGPVPINRVYNKAKYVLGW